MSGHDRHSNCLNVAYLFAERARIAKSDNFRRQSTILKIRDFAIFQSSLTAPCIALTPERAIGNGASVFQRVHRAMRDRLSITLSIYQAVFKNTH